MSEQARVPNVRSNRQMLADMTRGMILNKTKAIILTASSGEVFPSNKKSVVRIIQNLGINAIAYAIRPAGTAIDNLASDEDFFVLAAGTANNDGLGGEANLSYTTERIAYRSIDGSACRLSVLELSSPHDRDV